jgi:hypothetical protein
LARPEASRTDENQLNGLDPLPILGKIGSGDCGLAFLQKCISNFFEDITSQEFRPFGTHQWRAFPFVDAAGGKQQQQINSNRVELF